MITWFNTITINNKLISHSQGEINTLSDQQMQNNYTNKNKVMPKMALATIIILP